MDGGNFLTDLKIFIFEFFLVLYVRIIEHLISYSVYYFEPIIFIEEVNMLKKLGNDPKTLKHYLIKYKKVII